jgi:hypothetical protein
VLVLLCITGGITKCCMFLFIVVPTIIFFGEKKMFDQIKSWIVGIYAHLCVLCVLSKSLKKNEDAAIDMVLTAVVAAIVFAISIAIVYAVLGGIDYTGYDSVLTGTPAENASNSLLENLATFYTLGPIYIVVIAAVGIIAAVLMIRGR